MTRTVQPPCRCKKASATSKPPDPPRPSAVGLTCSDIQAIVYAKLGWPPPAGSAEENAETAPGLCSQLTRSDWPILRVTPRNGQNRTLRPLVIPANG
jgi:hypothetical protein